MSIDALALGYLPTVKTEGRILELSQQELALLRDGLDRVATHLTFLKGRIGDEAVRERTRALRQLREKLGGG